MVIYVHGLIKEESLNSMDYALYLFIYFLRACLNRRMNSLRKKKNSAQRAKLENISCKVPKRKMPADVSLNVLSPAELSLLPLSSENFLSGACYADSRNLKLRHSLCISPSQFGV